QAAGGNANLGGNSDPTLGGNGDGVISIVPTDVGAPTSVTVSGCTIDDNQAVGGTGGAGAGVANAEGGGLATLLGGKLTVSTSAVTDNQARGGASGGGIYNDVGSTLTVSRVVVADNQALSDKN